MDIEDLLEIVSDPQHHRMIRLDAPLIGGEELLPFSFRADESLTRSFSIQLQAFSRDPRIDLRSMLGQMFTLQVETASGEPRYFTGYVSNATNSGADRGYGEYQISLQSWLWFLTRRSNQRIFQDKAADEIISEIFSEYGNLPNYEFNLQKPLRNLSYCTQYKETDFAFVQRLIETHGLVYFFEQQAEGHRLVITDTTINLPALEQQPEIRFHRAEVTEASDSIDSFSESYDLEPSRVAVKTFDYKNPGMDSSARIDSKITSEDGNQLEIFEFPGAYEYNGIDEGIALARQHMEMIEANSRVFSGTGNARAMIPGRSFALSDHYGLTGATADRTFLITSVSHYASNNYEQASSESGYRNSFNAISADVPYRSPYSAPRPEAYGVQTAIVTGPPGEEIYTDALGRLKVQFHWDRYGKSNEDSSCWLRYATAGAGGGHGHFRLPRIGEEVVVEFIDGNPDRPIINGSVFNAQNPPPVNLPDGRNISGFVSRSTKGGGPDNASHLLFRDTLGQELVELHAEKDMKQVVENDLQERVGGSADAVIQKDSRTALKEGSYSLEVAKGGIEIVAAESISLSVGAASLHLSADGTIKLSGSSVSVNGSKIDLGKG